MALSDSRVWFITGSSQGLGRALLEEILANNERVVATLRNPAALAELGSKYPPEQLLVVPLDVSIPSQIHEAFERTKSHFGRLDVVVNNAGYGIMSEIESTPDEDARKALEVMFWGPVNITKEAIKFMRDVNPPGHGGRVLNVSSVGGYSANQTLAFYHAAKFALEGFTESFTKEMLPEWNIKGVIIEPGGFRTAWPTDSMIRLPSLPQYKVPHSPSSIMQRAREAHKFIGDPSRAAKAMMQVASMEDPPLRIQFGTDSVLLVRNKALKTIKDGERFEELSVSTDADDVDQSKVLEMFAFANK
ncbi:hypothetical protein EW026_g2903 [Hermanssonia centrifuga]|uniref:NAD(P)-binding protein n=1 Tax=Hermanssonia centrifuga TaxID=98765 RepID=A0A4S4KRG8_9APHY|nr:hypothetical protein EW026_g2903 [Hermanssonia centrifuga]